MEVIGAFHTTEIRKAGRIIPTNDAKLVADHIRLRSPLDRRIGIEGHTFVAGVHNPHAEGPKFKKELEKELAKGGFKLVNLEDTPEKEAVLHLQDAITRVLAEQRGLDKEMLENAQFYLRRNQRHMVETRHYQGYDALELAQDYLTKLSNRLQEEGRSTSPEFLFRILGALSVHRSKTLLKEAEKQKLPIMVVGGIHATHLETLAPEHNIEHVYDEDAHSPDKIQHYRFLEQEQLEDAKGLPTEIIEEILGTP